MLKSLGVLTGIKGEFSRSLGFLLQAYKQDKTDTALILNIATTYSQLGINDKALEFNKLLQNVRKK